jgi:hypothetical protein
VHNAYRAMLLTLVAVAAYFLGAHIPNPFLTAEAMEAIYGSQISGSRASFGPFALGIGPALSGFFLVEVCSFFLPPLSRWRREGFAGRARLNRAALILSMVLAVITATFMVRQMSALYGGQLSLIDGSFANMAGACAFFTGGFVIIYYVATLLSAHGLGNGFGLFLFVGALARLYQSFTQAYLTAPDGAPRPANFPALAPLLLTLLLVALFCFWMSRRRVLAGEHAGRAVQLEVPPVLQGLFAWSLAWQLTGLMATLDMLLQLKLNLTLDHSNPFVRYGLYFLFFTLASAFVYWAAYSPRRLLAQTFGRLTLAPEERVRLGRLALAAFAGVALFELFGHLPHPIARGEMLLSRAFDLGSLVAAYVLGKDIWQNFNFLRLVPRPVFVAELDNIHLASLIRAEALASGQPVYLKGFEYRRLLSFFQPLQKIGVYAAPEYAQTLRERVGLDSVPVV